MSFFSILVFLILLNVTVALILKYEKKRIIISALVIMFLCTPIVIAVTWYSIGVSEGAGIAGAAVGFTFGAITFVNGIIILLVGILFDA
ncbi:MAG: hypothetical protein ACQEUT_16590 [Bacillota bacterium]